MKAIDCGAVREAIPDLVHGTIEEGVAGEVRAHLQSCTACASELALVRMLFESRARAHPDLQARVRRGISFDRQALQRPWWALAAAAVAALALGIGMGSGQAPMTAPAFATEMAEAWPWVLEGELGLEAPVLDDLSDDALESLLTDLAQVDGAF